jgi:amino acid transporter
MIKRARTNYSLGGTGRFSFMAHWNAQRDAPVVAFIVTGAISAALVLVAAVNQGGVKFMVDFTAPVFWFFFLLTGMSLFVLRLRFPTTPRPFKVPMYPIVPIVFVCTCAFLLYRSLLFTLENKAIQIALYVMLAGIAVWITMKLRRPR